VWILDEDLHGPQVAATKRKKAAGTLRIGGAIKILA